MRRLRERFPRLFRCLGAPDAEETATDRFVHESPIPEQRVLLWGAPNHVEQVRPEDDPQGTRRHHLSYCSNIDSEILPCDWNGRLGSAVPSSDERHTWVVRFDATPDAFSGQPVGRCRRVDDRCLLFEGPRVEVARRALDAGTAAAMDLVDLPVLEVRPPPDGHYDRTDLRPFFRFPEVVIQSYVEREREGAPALSAALGAMMGMVVGDTVGAPLEFLPVVDIPLEEADAEQGRHRWSRRSLEYTGERNRFELKRGQWTDDASMGFCLADSILRNGCLDGSDARARFHCWWHHGYNNAFFKDFEHPQAIRGVIPHSVGLGGNTEKSLKLAAKCVPEPVYEADSEDSGNGSLIRLAPVSIFFSDDPRAARQNAALSSYTTHPGALAARACELLAFLTATAIAEAPLRQDRRNIKSWLDDKMVDFVRQLDEDGSHDGGYSELRRMIASAEPLESRERCWNWRSPSLEITRTLENRGDVYNGYAVDPAYFGAFCMDGLALALHSLYHSHSFDHALERCVNHLGDADSTGAIVGQLAGAFYGYESIDHRLIADVARWDGHHAQLRALLLFRRGKEHTSA